MSKKGIFYVAFFVILVSVFYLVVRKWISRNDTISDVQPFSFINQDGKRFTNKDVEGKVYVAEFFYTTCKTVCPRMNENMRLVYDKFKDNPDFLILSHTSTPDIDSASVLKRYADSLKIDTRHWVFLTGSKDSLYNAARISYTVDDPLNNVQNPQDHFLHTQLWALVNKEGKVKKIYDGLKQSEAKAMIKQITKMLDQ